MSLPRVERWEWINSPMAQWNHHTLIVAAMVGACCTMPVRADILQIDQSSPRFLTGAARATFTLRSNYAWQQEVRTQVSGVVDSLRLTCGGSAGSEMRIRVRDGTAGHLGTVLADVRVTKLHTGWEEVKVSLSGASIRTGYGRAFVLEIVSGTFPGATLAGNYAEPPAAPYYEHPLYYSGVPFSNGGWRIGFDLYVDPDACLTDLNGDGGVDASDLDAFFVFWETGHAKADINRDGGIDFLDAATFLDAWSNADC